MLSAFLGQHQYLVADKKVIDIGTGTGIAGLAAAQCGARDTTLTDRVTLGALVHSNIERNSGFDHNHVRFVPFAW